MIGSLETLFEGWGNFISFKSESIVLGNTKTRLSLLSPLVLMFLSFFMGLLVVVSEIHFSIVHAFFQQGSGSDKCQFQGWINL